MKQENLKTVYACQQKRNGQSHKVVFSLLQLEGFLSFLYIMFSRAKNIEHSKSDWIEHYFLYILQTF